MSHPLSHANTIDCLFASVLHFLLPFYLAAAGGDAATAQAAILELIEAYNAATAPELEVVGRLIGYNAAAMDSLRQSMRAGLSDRKVLQYRASAVALGRAAEQCRKVLEAMQAKRQPATEMASLPQQPPMPSPKPPPVAPLPPAAPPPRTPPAQPQALEPATAAADGNPVCAGGNEVAAREAQAIMARLHEAAAQLGPDMPYDTIVQMALHGTQLPPKDKSANT